MYLQPLHATDFCSNFKTQKMPYFATLTTKSCLPLEQVKPTCHSCSIKDVQTVALFPALTLPHPLCKHATTVHRMLLSVSCKCSVICGLCQNLLGMFHSSTYSHRCTLEYLFSVYIMCSVQQTSHPLLHSCRCEGPKRRDMLSCRCLTRGGGVVCVRLGLSKLYEGISDLYLQETVH